jgi:hypothetical protein
LANRTSRTKRRITDPTQILAIEKASPS